MSSPPALSSYMPLLDAFSGHRVLVVGDIILDKYVWGRVDRISPEAPVPVVTVERESYRLGGAANVANNLRVLGAVPYLLGVVGADTAGEEIAGELDRLGLSRRGVIVDACRRSTLKTRIIAHAQQVARVDQEEGGRLAEPSLASLLAALNDLLPEVGAVIVSDYGKGVVNRALLQTLGAWVRARGLPSVVDPKVDFWDLYAGFTVIAPNHHEAARATGLRVEDFPGATVAGRRLLEIVGCTAVIITWGERGMVVFERDGADVIYRHIPTVARRVYDVTGAGDTVVSALALGLAAGGSLPDAAVIANVAAGVVVGEIGTATVSVQDLAAELEVALHADRIGPMPAGRC
ncbi:MAG: bifunctional hydroxymethylpyrimidine kinase/phosphomethylpyrimidine kinase [Candidatus Schekmanbacteria bacterium]|nr:bifunctional hydroxymethylpyrimidine kinase/phosphomethylpyrimidine kinase [Candidatus Schekmanbacteria bacterium]